MNRITGTLATMALLGLLAGCGVDGAPIPPSDAAENAETGISVSGTASMGVIGGSSTISGSARTN